MWAQIGTWEPKRRLSIQPAYLIRVDTVDSPNVNRTRVISSMLVTLTACVIRIHWQPMCPPYICLESKARFPFKRNRLRCMRCVNENRKKRKRLRWQAANHGCHCFDRTFLLAGACVCCGFCLRNARNASDRVWMETGLKPISLNIICLHKSKSYTVYGRKYYF